MFYDHELKNAFNDFVYLYNNGYDKLLDDAMDQVGIELEGGVADEEETVFASKE
ncbi:MAG: hypothetical protein GYA51_07595 [Candidatus Methanofastidiosa archaeon]|nr:hypothetical protein [Candidatus Methanofastidiosa archaeon]